MSQQDLFDEARIGAEALQRVLKAVDVQEPDAVLSGPDYQLLGPTVQNMVQSRMHRKALQLQALSGRGGWWPMSIREPYTGAWQRNQEIAMDTVLSFSAVFACTTLIMGDFGKTSLRLVEEDENGIWNPVENAAYSPVLRKPNRYQNSVQFKETWIASKLNSGNTYVLKQRDRRGVVVAMYVLDPTRVTPLVTPDGAVYYELKRDDISNLPQEKVVVPASEIMHDRMNCLFHPLVGLSPIFACSLAAQQGRSIQWNSNKMFANGSIPSGVLKVPGPISDASAARVKAYWESAFTGDNVGKVAMLTDGMTYDSMSYNAVDMQLVEQLNLAAVTVCSAYRVPPYIVDIGPPPPYANIEPLIQKYYNVCLQSLMVQKEMVLDEGLGLGRQFENRYGTEFDPDDLIWMDAAAKSKAAQDGIGSGGMAPNEARKRYYQLGPVKGGETPFMQNQMWPLKQLSDRPTPTAPALPAMPVVEQARDEEEEDDEAMAASFGGLLHRKAIAAGLYAA